MVGKAVEFYLDRAQVEGYRDQDIQLSYWVETPGEASQVSGVLAFSVGIHEEIESGAFRVMGARFYDSSWDPRGKPRILTALRDSDLQTMRVEWRYESDERWTVSSQWTDRKPQLNLYVRSRSETWVCNPLNIVSTSFIVSGGGSSAFVAMRDEVSGSHGIEVDAVAWGNPAYGGTMENDQAAVRNVAQIHANIGACAALLRDGDVMCWGYADFGGTPKRVTGDFVQLTANGRAFLGQKADGGLYAWGHAKAGVPVPDHVLQFRDYRHLYPGGSSFCGLRENGKVVPWGDPAYGGQLRPGQEELDGVVDIMTNGSAYVALRDTGTSRSVFAWGSADHGGLLPDDVGRQYNVASLAAGSNYSFCIQLESGELITWPSGAPGGDLPEELVGATGTIEVSATFDAFCARLDSGKVVAWGNPDRGGSLPREIAGRTDIIQVANGLQAFAALCRDGSVVAWGHPQCGGDTASVAGELVDVRAIYGNVSGFVALTKDGRVVTWGVALGGGDSSKVQHLLHGKVTHSRLLPPQESSEN